MPVSRLLTSESRHPFPERTNERAGRGRGPVAAAAIALTTALALVAAPAAEALGLL